MVNAIGPARFWPRLLHALKPANSRHCLLCEAGSTQSLCRACRQDLPWNPHHCQRCALPLPASARLCAACAERSPRQSSAIAPLRYEFPVDHLVAGLKYHRHLENAPLLGQLLLDAVKDLPAPDLLLPVPLHRQRLAERGYNQALEIARPLSRHFCRPLEIRLLERTRATAAQMTLDAEARTRNPRGAFRLNATRLAELGTLQSVAIIDDVMTTGATLAEIAGLLSRAGIRDIRFWIVARTP
ncbi:MAG: ComF family protein [Pedobacter sp.]|nr:ComF family protein [Pedobacter sp.]